MVILLDLTKVFNMVNHLFLLAKQETLRVIPILCKSVAAYSLKARVGDELFPQFPVASRAPFGLILELWVFLYALTIFLS